MSDARMKSQVAVSVGLAIYARMTRLAHDREQTVREKNDYYVTLEQLESAFVTLRNELSGELEIEAIVGSVYGANPAYLTEKKTLVENNRNDTMEYWRSRAITAEQKILEFHEQIARRPSAHEVGDEGGAAR